MWSMGLLLMVLFAQSKLPFGIALSVKDKLTCNLFVECVKFAAVVHFFLSLLSNSRNAFFGQILLTDF